MTTTFCQACCFGPPDAPNTWGAGSPSALVFLPDTDGDEWPTVETMDTITAEINAGPCTFIKRDTRSLAEQQETMDKQNAKTGDDANDDDDSLKVQLSGYQMRWFIPGMELPMCGIGSMTAGHGLLRSGLLPKDNNKSVSIWSPKMNRYVVITDTDIPDNKNKNGSSNSGGNSSSPFYTIRMPVNKIDRLTDFATTYKKEDDEKKEELSLNGVLEAILPDETLRSEQVVSIGISAWFYMVVVKSPETVKQLQPDLEALKKLHHLGVMVTAQVSAEKDSELAAQGFDFVSRFFSPKIGRNEAHACVASHCTMFPFWGNLLGKPHGTTMKAKVCSSRGSEFYGKVLKSGEEVDLQGTAITFLSGTLLQKN